MRIEEKLLPARIGTRPSQKSDVKEKRSAVRSATLAKSGAVLLSLGTLMCLYNSEAYLP